MSLRSRKEYVSRMRERYQTCSSRQGKTAILNEVIEVTGCHRKYAITSLNSKIKQGKLRKVASRPKQYQEAGAVIQLVWSSLDYICAERLHPVLLSTAEHLERHGEVNLTPTIREQLGKISVSTLRRRISSWHTYNPKATITRPRKISTLKSEVPVQQYAWNEKKPGALEIDLVEHCGNVAGGHFAYTLNVVDIVSGYSRRRAVLGKGQHGILKALRTILDEWPMRPWGIHSDNGSEFLNAHLVSFCSGNNLQFTRSRPYKKNDNAHVEQKNRQYVREVVGYERYDSDEDVEWLNRVYSILDPYANYFLPMRKVVEKTRCGAKIRKRFDTAKTPLLRLIESGAMDDLATFQHMEVLKSFNPLELHRLLTKTLLCDSGEVVIPEPQSLCRGG